jgi:hypothetical protein
MVTNKRKPGTIKYLCYSLIRPYNADILNVALRIYIILSFIIQVMIYLTVDGII